MAESILRRVRRVASGGIEDLGDAMERAGGASVMREAIREVDRAGDEARTAYERAVARRLQAVRQRGRALERAAALGEKARFALAEGREDLAEAALSRQLDMEAEAERLDAAQVDGRDDEARLEAALRALDERKAEMQARLAAYEASRRDAEAAGAAARGEAGGDRGVRDAEAAFDRVMESAGGLAGTTAADAEAEAKVAEVDAMARGQVLAARLAALKAAGDGRDLQDR